MSEAMQCLKPTQTAAQQAISRLVHAYPLWTSGMVELEKWPRMVSKFAELYEADISPAARQWRKKKGRCSTHLVGALLPPDSAGREWVRWVLLVTQDGQGTVKELEKLRDARKDRITWGDYVLMYLTRPRRWGGGSRWTWCMVPDVERQEANYMTALAQACAASGDPQRMMAYTNTLLRRPMHSCVRTQVAKILRRARTVWDKHSSGKPWPGPDPSSLPIMVYRKTQDDLAVH